MFTIFFLLHFCTEGYSQRGESSCVQVKFEELCQDANQSFKVLLLSRQVFIKKLSKVLQPFSSTYFQQNVSSLTNWAPLSTFIVATLDQLNFIVVISKRLEVSYLTARSSCARFAQLKGSADWPLYLIYRNIQLQCRSLSLSLSTSDRKIYNYSFQKDKRIKVLSRVAGIN